MAGLQRFISQGYWQDAELEKLTFIGLYTAQLMIRSGLLSSPFTLSVIPTVNLLAEVVFIGL